MNIGLVAHDSKKRLMQNFCVAYRSILQKHEVYATETTGYLVETAANIRCHKYLAGPLGGTQQLGSQIENNDMDLVIFLREPEPVTKKERNAYNILALCDMHNIPYATNLASAEIMILALDRGDLDWREMYK